MRVAVCALPVPTRLQEKIRSLERLLEGGEGGLLDEAKLRGITSTGVPDTGGLRPILWRYLLQCVPRLLEGSALSVCRVDSCHFALLTCFGSEYVLTSEQVDDTRPVM